MSQREDFWNSTFIFMLIFISHSLCLLLELVGHIHMVNSQTINPFCVFKSCMCFNVCQYLLQTYLVQKETTGISEIDW